MKNIVLIGMSGVGKTVVGEYISRKNNMKLIDTDDIIEDTSGKTIPYIFKNYGEIHFRKLEFEIIKKLSDKLNTIISTGGGVVLDEDNINSLRTNGIIFFLEANLNTLIKNIKSSREERPLLDEGSSFERKVESISEKRKDLYHSSYDYRVVVDNKSIENIGDEVIHIYNGLK